MRIDSLKGKTLVLRIDTHSEDRHSFRRNSFTRWSLIQRIDTCLEDRHLLRRHSFLKQIPGQRKILFQKWISSLMTKYLS